MSTNPTIKLSAVPKGTIACELKYTKSEYSRRKGTQIGRHMYVRI